MWTAGGERQAFSNTILGGDDIGAARRPDDYRLLVMEER